MNASSDKRPEGGAIGQFLEPRPILFVLYAIACAFTVYLCMYSFRKAYDVGEYKHLYFVGTKIELKTAFVISQIIGYMLSKFLGSWICTSIRPNQRVPLLVGLVSLAELALVGFAILPNDWKALAMFCNGLPLGMIWGLVVSYLEGRRMSEILVVGLSCSYVVGGDVAKDVANNIVIQTMGVSEWWMPAVTGGLFFLPFLISVYFLNRLPPPNAADIQSRSQRVRMTGADRWAFLRRFGSGFILLLAAYFFLTAYRDFRDHFGIEILRGLGLGDQKAIFTRLNMWSGFAVLGAFGVLNMVRGHRAALFAIYGLIITSFALITLVTVLYQSQMIDGFAWYAAIGACTYLAYVPYGALLFERMVAATRISATSVFAIQLADGIGYSGSVFMQLFRDYFYGGVSRLEFFVLLSYVVSAIGVVMMTLSLWRLIPTIPKEEPKP